MKYSAVCPKCGEQNVVLIPGKVGAQSSQNTVGVGFLALNSIPVSRYVCLNCGYTEEWIDSDEHLRKIGSKYSRSTGKNDEFV